MIETRLAMDKRQRRIIAGALLGLVLLTSPVGAGESAALEISATGGLYSIDVAAADLREVMRQLAERGDFRLWISNRFESAPVSLRARNETLEKLLRRLLQKHSYALAVDAADGRVSGVYLLPPGDTAPAEMTIDSTSPAAQTLDQALASPSIPDNIKSALLHQAITNTAATRESIRQQRVEAIARLLELVESRASAQPETLQRLRELLEREQQAAVAE